MEAIIIFKFIQNFQVDNAKILLFTEIYLG